MTIEALLAATLLVTAMVPTVSMLQGSRRAAWGDERLVAARRLAGSVVARLTALPYDELRALTADGEGLAVDDAEGVTAAFAEVEPGLAVLTVEVVWSLPDRPATRRYVEERFVENPFMRPVD